MLPKMRITPDRGGEIGSSGRNCFLELNLPATFMFALLGIRAMRVTRFSAIVLLKSSRWIPFDFEKDKWGNSISKCGLRYTICYGEIYICRQFPRKKPRHVSFVMGISMIMLDRKTRDSRFSEHSSCNLNILSRNCHNIAGHFIA